MIGLIIQGEVPHLKDTETPSLCITARICLLCLFPQKLCYLLFPKCNLHLPNDLGVVPFFMDATDFIEYIFAKPEE